jgi:PAS domain-containing protein
MRLLSLPLELAALLAISLAIAIWQRQSSTRGRRTLVLLCLAVALVALSEWLVVRGFINERIGDRLKYAGTLTLAPLWIGFCAQVVGLDLARRVPWFPLLLLLPAACVYPLLWSSSYGSLFTVTVINGDDLRGPLWHVVTAYHQGLCVAGCAILASSASKIRDLRRALRSLVVALVPLAAMIGGIMHRGGLLAWPYDATPVLLGAGLLIMRDALLGSGLLDPLPFPQNELLRQLPIGVVMTDRTGTVSLINGAGARALGVSPSDALGRDAEQLLASATAATAENHVLQRGGRTAGRLLVFEGSR